MEIKKGFQPQASDASLAIQVKEAMSYSHGPTLCVVLVYVPLLVEIDEPKKQPVEGAAGGYLHIHGHKEGQEKEHPTHQRHQLRVGQVAPAAHSCCRRRRRRWCLLAEAHNGDGGAGHHDEHCKQEDAVQDLVAPRAWREAPRPAGTKLLVPLVLVLAELAARWFAGLLAQYLQPAREAAAVDVLHRAGAPAGRYERVIVSRRQVTDLAEGPALLDGHDLFDWLDELLLARCVRGHRLRPDVVHLGLARLVHGPRDKPYRVAASHSRSSGATDLPTDRHCSSASSRPGKHRVPLFTSAARTATRRRRQRGR